MPEATKALWATGRRKTSVARVRLVPGRGTMTVNGRPWDEFFVTHDSRRAIWQPLKEIGANEKYDVHATVSGGGPLGQAGALRHGIARALVLLDESSEGALRTAGFLTRDARRKERKKYGQRGARARFQFSKR